MTEPSYERPDRTVGRSLAGYARAPAPRRPESANLADILERVLDKGIVIAGDIQVNLLDIELLTIKLRLVIASVDRAKEMGIDWWEHDPTLSSRSRAAPDELTEENRRLRERVAALEAENDERPRPVESRGRARPERAERDHRDRPDDRRERSRRPPEEYDRD